MNEQQVGVAMEAYLSSESTKSIRQIAKEFGVPCSTLYRRLNGTKPQTQAYEENRALSKIQEQMLEGHLIFMSQKKFPLSSMETRTLAGKLKNDGFSSDNTKPLSNNWLLGFVSRCTYIELKDGKLLDKLRAQVDGVDLGLQFFDLYTHYIKKFNILPEDIWNLDEAEFKIGKKTEGLQFLPPEKDTHYLYPESSDLVSTLEMVSLTGKVGKPLLVYQGVYQLLSWYPDNISEEYDCTASATDLKNEAIFYEWLFDQFPESTDKWSFLLLNAIEANTSDRFMKEMLLRKVVPLYFPPDVVNILQPIDRSGFGKAKILARNRKSHNFGVGLNPTKAQFLETYMKVREQVYNPETIKEAWKRCGLFMDSPYFAIAMARKQSNNGTAMPQDAAEVESETEDAQVGENSTSETETKRKMRKRDPKITKEQSLLKRIVALEKKNRKLQSSFKQARRAATEALTSKRIALLQVSQFEKDLEEEKRINNSIQPSIDEP